MTDLEKLCKVLDEIGQPFCLVTKDGAVRVYQCSEHWKQRIQDDPSVVTEGFWVFFEFINGKLTRKT